MTTRLHEALHLNLFRLFDHQLGPRRLQIWRFMGCATFRTQGHPDGDGGEGDSSGGPKAARGTRDAWPTLVVLAGDSEPLGTLRDDMRWWFSASDRQVKIVLLTKFDHLRQRIIIERWEDEAADVAPQPVLRQSISIIRDPATQPYHVTRELVLPFRLLFLRDPSPQEGDVIMSIANLQTYADDVWPAVPD